ARATDAFDARAAFERQAGVAGLVIIHEYRVLGVDHREAGFASLCAAVTDVAAERGRSAACAGADHDPARHRVGLALHLAEDRFGDVVVATPVGGALGVGELIHVVPTATFGQPLCRAVHIGVIDEMALAAEEFDLRDLLFRRPARHHGE